MNKKVKTVLAILVLLVLISPSIIIYNRLLKIGYINSTQLFNEFAYKKELEAQLTTVQNKRKLILDSLELRFTYFKDALSRSATISSKQKSEFDGMRQDYLYKKQEFETDNSILAEKFNKQIWQQLNQYLQEYSDKEGFDFVFGVDGSGVIMASDKRKDVTKDAIDYCNEKFKGR